MPEREQAIKALKEHAETFLQNGLLAYTGYFPDDFYGKEATRYYRWSKRAYDLIKQIEADDAPGQR